ncbi:hypothetical protein E2C01_073643 [Portunus trituberculatus]|uniref:Uncharacterized protein n=1 Tax=Portunus trituberculatus TaxID=210409 RepID=A0A5B7I3K0_PORTR|nr:hypothetical protein [Portunus trituberculatus]
MCPTCTSGFWWPSTQHCHSSRWCVSTLETLATLRKRSQSWQAAGSLHFCFSFPC